MTNKNYSVISVIAASLLIPQLLFWWLAPASAAAYWAVYVAASVLTLGIPIAYLLTYWKTNLRASAGLAVTSGVLGLVTILLSVLLLAVNASIRSAVFAFSILALVFLSILIPMISSLLKTQIQGVYTANMSMEPDMFPSVGQNSFGHAVAPYGESQTAANVTQELPRRNSVNKPLPPRNR